MRFQSRQPVHYMEFLPKVAKKTGGSNSIFYRARLDVTGRQKMPTLPPENVGILHVTCPGAASPFSLSPHPRFPGDVDRKAPPRNGVTCSMCKSYANRSFICFQ